MIAVRFDKARDLIATRRQVEALSVTFAAQLRAWQRRLFRQEIAKALRDPIRYARAKKERGIDDELRELILRFGLRRGVDVANEAAGAEIIPGRLVQDAIAKKPIKIKWFWHWIEESAKRAHEITEEHKDKVRESVREILADAEADPRKPSLNETIRRIARTVHALPESGEPDADKVYAFGWERAAVIARTELAQVENTGKMAGYEATGVEYLEWLSYSDGLSGDRHHERLNAQVRRRGETWTDGLGNALRYPADPLAHISSTINCRCTMRPARRR